MFLNLFTDLLTLLTSIKPIVYCILITVISYFCLFYFSNKTIFFKLKKNFVQLMDILIIITNVVIFVIIIISFVIFIMATRKIQ